MGISGAAGQQDGGDQYERAGRTHDVKDRDDESRLARLDIAQQYRKRN
jgi:hypothetical protein